MTDNRPTWARVVVLAFLASVAHAQSPPRPAPSERSMPHEKLVFFEGTWAISDSPTVQAFRETCGWLPEGRRHMVCRSRWNTPTGPREGLSILSYDSTSGEYVYNGFRAGGAHVSQRGREESGRWTFSSEVGQAAERTRHRVTIEPDGHGGYSFLSEVAKGDGAWKEEARVVYRRASQ